MTEKKVKVGDVIKSDEKFDYVVSQLGPKLLYKIQYENLKENFAELVPADKVKDLDDNFFRPKDANANFASEGDKVKAELFGEWKTATVLCTKFGECEITCYKKGTKKSYFSEWITLAPKEGNEKTKETNLFIPTESDKVDTRVLSPEPGIRKYTNSGGFEKLSEKVDSIITSEKWDEVISNLNSFYIKPQWSGQPLNHDYNIFLLTCNFDKIFVDRLKILLESSGLTVTTSEEELHKSRVLLLLYTDNASYDATLIRLLTRGAELANSGELCIKVLVHPTCSAFRQNRIPDNMAYSLADSKWYNWIGVDSPEVSFTEMASQIKSYTERSDAELVELSTVCGIWHCKVVVSGDFCSNFYDNRCMTLYLYTDHDGKIRGRTPSGIVLEGDFNTESRILDITGAYCGPWNQENEGWKEEYFQIMLRIKGVLDYKGSRFEGQICEVSCVGDKVYECVGTLSADQENEGVSGFYEITDTLSELKGEKGHMTIIQQRGGDLLADIKGHHGVMYPGIFDSASRRFWLYVQNTPNSCTTYEGVFNAGNRSTEASGSFFKCKNGVTVIPKTKFYAKREMVGETVQVDTMNTEMFLQLVADAQQRSLRTSVINSFTYVPPKPEDFPVLIVGAEEDGEVLKELKYNLLKAGVGPISCDANDLDSARSVCFILSAHVRDNTDLVETAKKISVKDVPFFIIANDARRNIFNDKFWKDLNLKETLLSCLARLKQTGKMTLDPNSLLFKTLVKEVKSNYKPPVYFLSGMWSVRTFSKVDFKSGYNEAAADARKGKVKHLTFPKLLYILTDGVSGRVVGINDFVSSKQFKGHVNNEESTFTFDNEDSKYELVIERDGQTMQGTYINRVQNIQMEITLTLEIDEISGIYTVKEQNQMLGIVKTGQHSVDVYYRNYILPGVFYGSRFYCTIPRCVNRKPVLSTMVGVIQKSMSGSSLICFEYASLANTRCLSYVYDYLQTRFQKLDEADKIGVSCEAYVLDFIERFIEAFNDVDYVSYKELHTESVIEGQDAFEAYCKSTHDIMGKIENYSFVGRRKMLETNLSHLSISRYEFDIKYGARTRREFFIIDENCLLRGTMSLEEEALQFHSSIYDVMITYRSTDSGWADLLQMYLENNEVLCWRDQRMEIGANWSSDITSAIRLAKCELCLLSEEYLKSEMCTKEISLAFDSGKLIIPLVLPHTDQSKPRPLVKSTYKPSYPPHQISHETSQSTWIDFRPASSDVDPENVAQFELMYLDPLKVLLDRLQLSKTRSNICDINGSWLVSITDTVGRKLKSKVALEYIRRVPSGVLQEESGKPVARLSPQSIVCGTRLLLYFVNPKTYDLVLGIKAMMSGDNRSFSGVLLGADCRSVVYAQKVEDKFRSIERGGLVYTAETASPNYDLLTRLHPQISRTELDELFTAFCKIDISQDYRLSPDEITSCLKMIGRPMSKRLVSEQIRRFDVKQSGALEFDEFVHFLSKQSGAGAITSKHASKVCSIM